MITNNFKAFLSTLLEARAGDTTGIVEVKNLAGSTRYIAFPYATQSFPISVSRGLSLNNNMGGLLVGKGTAAPTAADYNMTDRITSGLSVSTPTQQTGADENGNPYLYYIWVISNSTASDITITEVGYAQFCYGSSTLGGTASASVVMLFDHTLLEEPLTVPANGQAVLKYTLKTVIS